MLIVGLNKDLVEICVEYLNQPLAKKEEGLFRVSGDSSVIKSLHSTFMTPDQDIDLLRYMYARHVHTSTDTHHHVN